MYYQSKQKRSTNYNLNCNKKEKVNNQNKNKFEVPTAIKRSSLKKANIILWNEHMKVTFDDFFNLEENKHNKITSKDIFKNTIDKSEKPLWTSKQTKWISEGVDLQKIFSKKIRTISKIEDFRRKFFMRYWNYFPQTCCPLCNENFGKKDKKKNLSIDHILYKCKVIRKWELKLKMNTTQRNQQF